MYESVESNEIYRCARCRTVVDLDEDGYYDKETWELLCWDCWKELYGKPKPKFKPIGDNDNGWEKREWETHYP